MENPAHCCCLWLYWRLFTMSFDDTLRTKKLHCCFGGRDSVTGVLLILRIVHIHTLWALSTPAVLPFCPSLPFPSLPFDLTPLLLPLPRPFWPLPFDFPPPLPPKPRPAPHGMFQLPFPLPFFPLPLTLP